MIPSTLIRHPYANLQPHTDPYDQLTPGSGADPRPFQGRSTLEIVRELVSSANLECSVAEVLSQPPGVREYCVQYQETDLAFIRRLMQEDGISWWMDDTGEASVLRLFDSNDAVPAVSGPTEFGLNEVAFDEAPEESIQSLAFRHRTRVAGVLERSWNWLDSSPGVVDARAPHEADEPLQVLDQLRRNGADVIEHSVKREHERLGAQSLVGRGTSNIVALTAGQSATVAFEYDDPISLLVTRVQHTADCPEVEPGAPARSGPNYTNAFECHPLEVPYRPQRTTLRPRIHSLHTAVVTGRAGEEIQTDTHGRIKVRMHWDRSGGPDDDASCWLRVAQSWAGNGWGSSFIPRVGMEVLVAFLDGDPDRPLCVGSVYNGGNQTPYALPDDKTKSTIRTQSSPGGDGYNELTFEDAAGAEEVYVRAQRNLRTQVLHNESRSVGADQSVSIGHDQTLAVEGDRHTTIKGNHTLAIDGGGTEGVKGSQVTVNGDVEIDVTGTGVVKITAATRIELHVGASSIVMDGQTIMFHAGAGTMQRLDEAALVMAGRGSLMRLSSTVMVNAATGATLQMDGVQTTLASNAGSHITLSDTATVGAGLGSVLELTADATINAATITAKAGQGSTLTLDANAAMMGLEASCTGHGGSLKVGPSGAALDGTKVDITAAAAASLVAPMVKIN